MEILRLFPFSVGEQLEHRSAFIDDAFAEGPIDSLAFSDPADRRVWDWVVSGGFPEATGRTDPLRRDAWFGSYVTTILQRDVREISNIENLSAVPRLLSLLASRIGGLLNMADISRALGIPHTTLTRYMALLEATFLIRLLPAWTTNLGLRLVKAPKLHFVDTGLACSLLGAGRERVETDASFRGAMLESFVALELTKQASWSQTQPALFHFRTTTGREVDVVMEGRQGTIVGVEVKASETVRSSDFAGLRKLREVAGERFRRGIVVYPGREHLTIEEGPQAIPVSRIWS